MICKAGFVSVGVLLLVFVFGPAQAEQAYVALPDVVVTAQREKRLADELPAVEGAKIYSGKKTSYVDLQQKPVIINNNYRQALDQTPGLLVSEESTPLISIGYRGLAPDRVQFTQVLKDGVPITADMYGYPEAYYTPPFQTVDHVDFIRGGAGLLYGPQPGGAINFVTKEPYAAGPFALVTENAGGSHGLYSHYTGISGTLDHAGYYAYVHHRQSQGFRDHNSQSEVYYGGSKVQWNGPSDARWGLDFDIYNEKHGEPGGLTRADFDGDPHKTTRLNDHFELNRYAGALNFEKDLDEAKSLYWKTFGGYYQRLSWRQRGGGFGTLPSGAASWTNDIQDQEFYSAGTEGRFKETYDAFGFNDHVLTGGILYYHSTSPRSDKRGTSADADDGDLRQKSRRTMNTVSVFAENLFRLGRLMVTPGVRLENIWQGIKEKENLDKTTVPLADDRQYDFVPLFGLGMEYEITPKAQVYTNISQSYRPKTFAQAVPTGSGQTVNGDLEEGNGWEVDFGVRGRPVDFYNWDINYFFMRFDDQIGTSGTTVDNVGDAAHQGVELANQLDLIGVFDALNDTSHGKNLGQLDLFANIMVLDARFIEGPNKGKTPQYAPDFIFKTGLEYHKDRMKLRLSGTFVDDHFGNDTNTTQFLVPSYKVWDLTTDVKVYKDMVSIFGGINNLFDEHYYARVNAGGIDPADGRNYYGGLKFIW
ncbi:MAG: TonB-dependent receptor plug domain-containing protein [Candidatus Omnitrophota bacterium]|nr:TonB-dependent receptor plug domain-containing protein [Candidatus Omnitrophota bacterium]